MAVIYEREREIERYTRSLHRAHGTQGHGFLYILRGNTYVEWQW